MENGHASARPGKENGLNRSRLAQRAASDVTLDTGALEIHGPPSRAPAPSVPSSSFVCSSKKHARVLFRLGWLSECSKDVLLFGLALCSCRARLSSLLEFGLALRLARCDRARRRPSHIAWGTTSIERSRIVSAFPCSWKTTFLTKTVSRKRKKGRKSVRTEQNTL